MNTPTQDPLPGLFWPPKLPRAKGQTPRTYRTPEVCLMTLREVSPESPLLEGPAQLAAYVAGHIMSRPEYPRHIETLMAIAVNARRRLIAHTVLAMGTQDTILVHPREVFRFAIMAGANAIGIAHNHPSGDPTPSEGDIRVTRDLARAGQLLRIDLMDHVIIGSALRAPGWTSLRELGCLHDL